MSEYETRAIKIVVAPKGSPIFSELATTVEICDEAGGEFVEVAQSQPGCGKILIEAAEWPAIRDAIEKMLANCRV